MGSVKFGCSTATGRLVPGRQAGRARRRRGLPRDVARRRGIARPEILLQSYCLVPHSVNTSSALNFGALANVTEPGAASTPLVVGDVDTYYTVVLDSVKVGNKTVASAASSRIIVDSGTTLTFLDPALMGPLVDELSRWITLPPVQSPDGLLQLCYEVAGQEASPDLTLEFGLDAGLDVGADAGERVRDGAGRDAVPGDRGDNGAAAGVHPREPRAAEHPRRPRPRRRHGHLRRRRLRGERPVGGADERRAGAPQERKMAPTGIGTGRARTSPPSSSMAADLSSAPSAASLAGVCERGVAAGGAGGGGRSGHDAEDSFFPRRRLRPLLPSQALQPPPPPFSRVVVAAAAASRASPTVQPRGRTRRRRRRRTSSPPASRPTERREVRER
ncbi:Os10g0447300 [Oryza sativa Japonica Group]|uniref:Os10g0447300 protein n=1 Tax=Oryza sativa subsp. japonica TaxID=39947 RepID=A0A0P0XUU5_ORYSJ|nr:Os10g0447300 [Oryza sativa Japonica Group]